MSTPPERPRSTGGPHPVRRLRAVQILRIRKIWIAPLVLAAVFVAVMATIYLGSVVNPTGHIHDLPVMVVNEDQGATVQHSQVDLGASVVSGLEHSPAVSSRLKMQNVSLAKAKSEMDRGRAYATLVIPSTFSRSALLAAGVPQSVGTPPEATVELLENSRLGSLGVNLAAGVVTPAVGKISPEISAHLSPLASPSVRANPILAARLAAPIALQTSTYRPLPDHSALGLSAFYIALLAIMAGFISGTLINNSINAALGYGPTELGPRYKQRRPVPIDRRQTFLVKWAIAAVAAPLLTGVLMLIAVSALGMYAPHAVLLWLLCALAALMIATGTLALLAAFGSIGQLLAMILLVYLSLASSGGTVPIQALPGVFRTVGHVEPLRNVLSGTRAILYFGARGDAGLTHSLIVLTSELGFWAMLALVVTTMYDRRGLDRISPDLLSYIDSAVEQRTAAVSASGD